MYEIIPDKKAIVYSKEGGKSYTNLFDIATQKQNKNLYNDPYNPPYGETELEVINDKKYYKTTSYERVDNQPTVQDLKKVLSGK